MEDRVLRSSFLRKLRLLLRILATTGVCLRRGVSHRGLGREEQRWLLPEKLNKREDVGAT